jgi:hypothetical protein
VLRERSVRACRVPWEAIAGRDTIEIGFHTPDAAQPAALSNEVDDRVLGVAFSSLQLHRDADDPNAGETGAGFEPTAAEHAGGQISDRELMFKFESLGQNCEFGLVQRRCEAEPLGLLRFASTPLPHLLAALEGDFEGLGAPEAVTVQVSANGQEYMVADRRYGLLYHAWVRVGEMAPEDVRARETRRLPILVRKLREDLDAAEKIFVFKGMGPVPEDEVMPLVAAIRRYGPNTLMLANLADAQHPSGTVERRGPGSGSSMAARPSRGA